MTRFRIVPTLLPLLLAVGCASQPQHHSQAQLVTPALDTVTTSEVVTSDTTTPASTAAVATEPPTTTADATATTSATADSSTPQDDYAAIYGSGTSATGDDNGDIYAAQDPWEHMNRKVHAFNTGVDRLFARPLARGYVKVVPQPLRTGVSNFYDNLITPLAFGNLLLQGRPSQAFEALGRFIVNSTVGIAGLFAPATKALKMHRHSADFGRTLARWGWRHSRYLEVPFLGPRTLRDGVGSTGDLLFSPLSYVQDASTKLALQALRVVDVRAGLLPLDVMRENAPDDYVLTRDAWLARRQYLLDADRSLHDQGNEPLPAYLLDAPPEPSSKHK